MGIVNGTPDSFSDGGEHASTDAAVAQGLKLAGEGADILDIGGESTRPGAEAVAPEEELRRVLPVIERLAKETDLPVSIDTSHPEVMRAAVAAGAGMINDVYRSEEHTSELQSLMRISYAVFCLKNTKKNIYTVH